MLKILDWGRALGSGLALGELWSFSWESPSCQGDRMGHEGYWDPPCSESWGLRIPVTSVRGARLGPGVAVAARSRRESR